MYEVESIDSQAGLYFEEIGKLNLYHDDWKLVTYMNLTIYQEEFNHVKSMVGEMFKICDELKGKSLSSQEVDISCGPILEQIELILQELEEYNIKWFMGNRKKRALLNIVGSVSKTLFGTLDEQDAAGYLAEFENLKKQNKLRDRITEKHTSLIQSLTNLVISTEDSRKNQTDKLLNQINSIKNSMENLLKTYAPAMLTMKLKTQVQDMTSYVILLVVNFKSRQRQILETITVGQKSPNSPALIPPQMFLSELIHIRGEINSRDLDLPLEPKTEYLTMFYSISTPEARIIGNQLVVSFTLPLVTKTEYILYKISSLPHRIKENIFKYIIPTHEFLAMDSFKDKYVSIGVEELDNCHHLENRKLACKQTTPIMATYNTANCEVNMLKMMNNLEICQERISNLTGELWIKLRQTNTYLYVFPGGENVYIKCGKFVENKYLEGTGKIFIQPNCQIKTDKVIIHGFKTIETDKIRQIIPIVKKSNKVKNILEKAMKLDNFHIKEVSLPSVVSLGQKEKLQMISVGVDEIKMMENELRDTWTPQMIRNSIWKILSAILLVILIFGVLIGWLIVQKLKKLKKDKKLSMQNRAIKFDNVEEPKVEIKINVDKDLTNSKEEDKGKNNELPVLNLKRRI